MTSTRLFQTLSQGALFALLLTLAVPVAEAAELQLTVANDPVSGSSRPDDLYTAELGLAVDFERVRVTAGERMFTDRERGLRFDETFLTVGLDLPDFLPGLAGWEAEADLGVLRAGRGLLGQDVQNEVHRWTGSDEVNLPYAPGNHHFLTAELSLARPLRQIGATHLRSEAGAFTAPGFRHWLRAGVVAERPLGDRAAVRFGLGARADQVDTDWLGDRISDVAPTAELAVAYRSLILRWSYNDYGTRTGHLTLAVRLFESRRLRGRLGD
jgi:hypothetical protein